jgi:hypothetical protein
VGAFDGASTRRVTSCSLARLNNKTPRTAADAVFGTVAGTILELLGVAMVVLGIRRPDRAGPGRQGLRPAPLPRVFYYMAGGTLMVVGFLTFGQPG